MDTDLISILLPVYNGEATLTKSIESVLNQSYLNFELLIINDGSKDESLKICRMFDDSRIKIINNEKNSGLINSLNKGLNMSEGKFIARIDADDIWIDEYKLFKQIQYFKNNPLCVLVGTQAHFSNSIYTKYPLTDMELRSKILSKNVFIHSSVMFKKQDLYNIKDYLVEDYSLWLKLGLKGTFVNLPDVCVYYLINPTGETRTQNYLQTKNSLALIKQYKNLYPNYFESMCTWRFKLSIRKVISLLHLK